MCVFNCSCLEKHLEVRCCLGFSFHGNFSSPISEYDFRLGGVEMLHAESDPLIAGAGACGLC